MGGLDVTPGAGWTSPAVPAGSEYTEAEALIVTYSLNNFPRDDPRHQWALSWESRFLEVVGDFQRAHSPNLSVTFMAEVRHPPAAWGRGEGTLGCRTPPSSPISPFRQRSLEDEINRTTGEDIPVFAVSYLVVFAYIALALGEYTAWRRVLVRAWGGVMG